MSHMLMAQMSEHLPAAAYKRPRILRRRQRGLQGIPERYRLQFLLMAAERLPGRTPAEAVDLAGRLADTVRIPAGLARSDDARPLDEWFKSRADDIARQADELAEANR